MIFTTGSCVVGDNDTAFEILVNNPEFERTIAVSAASVIVNIIIFVLFICILIIYLSIIYRICVIIPGILIYASGMIVLPHSIW